MTDDMMAYRRWFLKAICWEEKVHRLSVMPRELWKQSWLALALHPSFFFLHSGFTGSCGTTDRGKSQRSNNNGILEVCVCCGAGGGNRTKAWKTCNAVRLFVMCSRALQQQWGFGKPSPHRQVDRSRGIPDIFWLFVFHQEGSRCSRLLLQSALSLFDLHITPEHAQTMSAPTENPLQKVN